MARLTTPRALLLLLLMWLPLMLHVMFGRAGRRELVLLPAIPATCCSTFSRSRLARILVAVIGATLVFFWLLDGGHGAVPAAARSQQADRAVRPPLTEKSDVFFWLGTDYKGRDMLSRTDLGLPAGARLGRHRDRSSPMSSAR